MIPAKFLFAISGIIDLNIATFLFTRSSLVSPGFCPAPADILTQVAIKLSGLPENRVIGSGTVLDSARLRYKLGEHLSVDSRSVHAFILGEHGDSEVVAWSSANVSGVPLSEMCEMRGHYKHKENTEEIATAVKNSAYEIINKKHATYYGIAMSVKRICEVIMRDEKSILPISHMIHGIYSILFYLQKFIVQFFL